jgi:hypothetical protein
MKSGRIDMNPRTLVNANIPSHRFLSVLLTSHSSLLTFPANILMVVGNANGIAAAWRRVVE